MLWAPGGVRGWLAGVLAAGLAGYLSTELASGVRRVFSPRGPAPVVVTAQIFSAVYVKIADFGERSALIPASGHTVRLIVESPLARSTVLRALRPVIVSRGTASGEPSFTVGVIEPRNFSLSLDNEHGVVRPAAGGHGFPFRVSADDPEVFEIEVRLAAGWAEWFLELDWTSGGRRGSTRIYLGDHAFSTAAMPAGARLHG